MVDSFESLKHLAITPDDDPVRRDLLVRVLRGGRDSTLEIGCELVAGPFSTLSNARKARYFKTGSVYP